MTGLEAASQCGARACGGEDDASRAGQDAPHTSRLEARATRAVRRSSGRRDDLDREVGEAEGEWVCHGFERAQSQRVARVGREGSAARRGPVHSQIMWIECRLFRVAT